VWLAPWEVSGLNPNSPNHSAVTELLMRTVNVVAVVKQPGNIYVLLHTWVDITVVHTNIIFGTGITVETGSYSCFQLHPLCNALLAHISAINFILKTGFMHMCAGLRRPIKLLLFYPYIQKTDACYPAKYLRITADIADSKSQ
jgi:hypothetical protein